MINRTAKKNWYGFRQLIYTGFEGGTLDNRRKLAIELYYKYCQFNSSLSQLRLHAKTMLEKGNI